MRSLDRVRTATPLSMPRGDLRGLFDHRRTVSIPNYVPLAVAVVLTLPALVSRVHEGRTGGPGGRR